MKIFKRVTGLLALIIVLAGMAPSITTVYAAYYSDHDIANLQRGVVRTDGNNRMEVSANIAYENWPNGADDVFIIGGDDAASAIPAVGWANQLDAPMIIPNYGSRDVLSNTAADAIRFLNPSRIHIIGGLGSVTSTQEQQIRQLVGSGTSVSRAFGSNRETSAELYNDNMRRLIGNWNYYQDAILINGVHGLSNGFSVVAQAADNNIPIFYTNRNGNISASVRNELNQFNNLYVIGNTTEVPSASLSTLSGPRIERISGSNTIETNLNVLRHSRFRTSNDRLYIATVDEFADATMGALISGKHGSGIMLVGPSITHEQWNFIEERYYYRFDLLGGTTVLPLALENSLNSFFRAPHVSSTVTVLPDQDGARLSVSASGSQSGIYRVRYRTPGGSWSAWSGGASWFNDPRRSRSSTWTVSQNGTYTLEVEDRMGHRRTATRTVSGIDVTPPTGSISASTTSWTNQNVTLTFTASDSESGVRRVQTPSGTWVNNHTATFTVTRNGTYTFVAEDIAGNTRSVSRTVSNIDKTTPNGVVSGNPTSWTRSNVTLSFSGSDSGPSGVRRVRRPNGTWVSGSSTTHTVSSNGTYTFRVEDNAGNRRDISTQVNRIDKTPPGLSTFLIFDN